MTCDINIDRLLDRLEALRQIGGCGSGCTRLAFSREDGAGRDRVVQWMREAELQIRIDAIGNIFGLSEVPRGRRFVMMGSHIDTVAGGGKYDGNLGVLAGIEIIQTLKERGIRTGHPLAVAVFSNEEGARYAPDMMGSLVFSGALDAEAALKTVGEDGTVLGTELARIGYAGDRDIDFHIEDIEAFIELHIEQGPVLSAEGFSIGCVEGVQGISWTEYVLTGTANHAGTTPLSMRRDAGLVAGQIVSQVREICRSVGQGQVGTVGSLALTPNIINVVPAGARLTVDLRNNDDDVLRVAEQRVREFVHEAATAESVTVQMRSLVRTQPVSFEPSLIAMIEDEARRLGLRTRRMASGAGHDAQFIASGAPAAMIFIPSVGGISHNTAEHTDPQDIEAGAATLLRVISRLAGVASARKGAHT